MTHSDIPLTDLGQRQAHAVAELLPQRPSQLLCSTFLRTQQTAAPYAQKVGIAPSHHALLHEFNMLAPDRIAGMTQTQRKPLVEAYWQAADPHVRTGQDAESFNEFASRVDTFMQTDLRTLPDQSVLFGHGTWLALMIWRIMGFDAQSSNDMQDFRGVQLGLPMPNCAIYRLQESLPNHWQVKVDAVAMNTVRAVA